MKWIIASNNKPFSFSLSNKLVALSPQLATRAYNSSKSVNFQQQRLRTKDKELLRLIDRKVNDILADPYRFKPLRKPLQNKRRVHVAGHFVLIYEITEREQLVTLLDFDHHDNIYKM